MTHHDGKDIERDECARAAARNGALTLAALGVVFGDIGTSPLYAFRESFEAAGDRLVVNEASALGAVSLILWSLIIDHLDQVPASSSCAPTTTARAASSP